MKSIVFGPSVTVAFRPDDAQVRVVWAFDLLRSKETAAALEQTRVAESFLRVGLVSGIEFVKNPENHYPIRGTYA